MIFWMVVVAVLIACAALYLTQQYAPPPVRPVLITLVIVMLALWIAWYTGVPIPGGWGRWGR